MLSKSYTLALSLFFISLVACKASAFLESPNSLRNVYGKLFLKNGKTEEGKLIINTSNSFGSPIKVYSPDDKEPMKFTLHHVKGYEMRGNYYALKDIREGISFGRNYSFMKRLTAIDSRIHLYENLEKSVTNNTNKHAAAIRYTANYYMQIPGEKGDAVYAIAGNKFTPDFDKKMSAIVADCPTLAKKIQDREKEYFYRQMGLYNEKRAEVLLNIIGEYNRCR